MEKLLGAFKLFVTAFVSCILAASEARATSLKTQPPLDAVAEASTQFPTRLIRDNSPTLSLPPPIIRDTPMDDLPYPPTATLPVPAREGDANSENLSGPTALSSDNAVPKKNPGPESSDAPFLRGDESSQELIDIANAGGPNWKAAYALLFQKLQPLIPHALSDSRRYGSYDDAMQDVFLKYYELLLSLHEPSLHKLSKRSKAELPHGPQWFITATHNRLKDGAKLKKRQREILSGIRRELQRQRPVPDERAFLEDADAKTYEQRIDERIDSALSFLSNRQHAAARMALARTTEGVPFYPEEIARALDIKLRDLGRILNSAHIQIHRSGKRKEFETATREEIQQALDLMRQREPAHSSGVMWRVTQAKLSGRKIADIAQAFDMKPDAAFMAWSRGRRRLAELLKEIQRQEPAHQSPGKRSVE